MSAHNWIETWTGVAFDLDEPRAEDVRVEDIAHALSRQCRFGGGVREFYSVAQHSIFVSRLCSSEAAFAGLMHDSAEAYVTDLPTPVKNLLPEYRKIEARVWFAICGAFGLAHDLSSSVKNADKSALFAERFRLRGAPVQPWYGEPEGPEPPEVSAAWERPMSPDEAKASFLSRFDELFKARHMRGSAR